MLTKERIIELLESLHEHTMARDIFVPVLREMGLQGVKFVGGPDEQGVDIEYFELTQPENHRSPVAIQFKKGSLHYSARGDKDSVKEVQNQAEEAFQKEIFDLENRSLGYVSRYIVAVTGDINEPARKLIGRARLKGNDRRIDYWTGDRLAEYVQNNWMEEFENYFREQLEAVVEEAVEEDASVVDADYIFENYEEEVSMARNARATVNNSEWAILRTLVELSVFRNSPHRQIPIADVLIELRRNEDYLDEELRHLRQLGYIWRDEDGMSLSGHATGCSRLARTILNELRDAVEDPGQAGEIFDQLVR